MNTVVKVAIGFVAGAVTGGVGTYFGLRSKFARETQKEINEYRELARQRIRAANEFAEKAAKEEKKSEEAYDKAANSYDKFVDYTSFYDGESAVKTEYCDLRSELNVVSKAVEDGDFDKHMSEREHPEEEGYYDLPIGVIEEDLDEELDNEEKVEALRKAREDQKLPYPIDAAEFHNTQQWYEKITLTYFEGNDVLTDDREDPIDNPEELVGTDYKNLFGMIDEDETDIVMIRNDRNGCDYEICRVPASYVGSDQEIVITSNNGPLVAEDYSDKVTVNDEPVIHIS